MESILNATRPRNIEKVAGSANKFVHLAEE
jgi:hypothetical protein